MANKFNTSLQKGRKRVQMRTRILHLILLVLIFQLSTFSAGLIFGGEFRDLKEYSYNTLVEKTESSSISIRNELQGKPSIVQAHAEQLSSVVSRTLSERGATIADLQTDKALVNSIIKSSAGIVSSLLRRSMADDAYLILDTGDLYAGEDGDAKAALYLQDGALRYGDPWMVLGFDSVALDLGIVRNPDWEQYFTPDPEDEENFDFYYRTIQTAQENSDLAQNELGYWSGFSKAAAAVVPSVKYSLPLIAGDGTVYGVLGVGLTEDSLLANIPSPDFSRETACYVLGHSPSGQSYNILTYSGSAYSTLLGDAKTLRISSREAEGVYRFDMVTDVDLAGSVQYMQMYSPDSPYTQEQWALFCVADRSNVLHPLLFLQRMLGVSAVVSLIVAAVVTFLGCGAIVKPLSNLSKLIRAKRKYNEVLRFQPSNIYEIDDITDAITQLQINVLDFSSQVSRMISIADVGVGTFMYDRTDDSVFVGQSLIKVLRLNLPQSGDIVMGRTEFLNSIKNPDVRIPIADGLEKADGNPRGDTGEVYKINRPSGSTEWMRLSFTYSPTSAIGIVQDITDTIVEKNRIEYERDHDALTGLLTRHAYYRRIEKLFQDKSQLKITAFVMIDLDNLKYVNDTYGHSFGDTYIRTAATILKEFEKRGGIVARLSGDEFNVCLPGFSSKNEIRKIVAYMRAKLQQGKCLLADGTHHRVRASMGVSWYPDDADSYEMLMKYADFAMYTVKHATKGSMAEFDINSYTTDSGKVTDLDELNRIIEGSRVQYAFQSIVAVKTGEVYGYEALMRVQSEIFQSPLELLSTAKATARLHEIERLTWTKGLADFQTLLDAGRIDRTAHLFVNSIANHRLEDEVIASLERTYPHLLDHIVMEILESESSDAETTNHKEDVLRRWGAQIALDDYGTGYNSEYALLSLHPHIIKIDRSIISGCDRDNDRRMIIENLVKLAQAKSVLVLAEGVETEGEMKTAIACGVDFLQGYYLAHPVFAPEPIKPELSDMIRRLAALANID